MNYVEGEDFSLRSPSEKLSGSQVARRRRAQKRWIDGSRDSALENINANELLWRTDNQWHAKAKELASVKPVLGDLVRKEARVQNETVGGQRDSTGPEGGQYARILQLREASKGTYVLQARGEHMKSGTLATGVVSVPKYHDLPVRQRKHMIDPQLDIADQFRQILPVRADVRHADFARIEYKRRLIRKNQHAHRKLELSRAASLAAASP